MTGRDSARLTRCGALAAVLRLASTQRSDAIEMPRADVGYRGLVLTVAAARQEVG